MNIQDAIIESLKSGKAIKREDWHTVALSTKATLTSTIEVFDATGRKAPGKGWQPFYEDLIADDWRVINIDYRNLIADYKS